MRIATKRLITLAVASVVLVTVGEPSWGLYAVRISDLHRTPLPPNPVLIWGRVVSETPLRISDGAVEVTVSGLQARAGDFLVLKGNWDGGVFTVPFSIPFNPVQDLFYTMTPLGTGHTVMQYMPAGQFPMGNNGSEPYTRAEECPQHPVYLSGYWIGRYEVTRGEYRQFMDAGGYSNPAYWSSAGWSWKASVGRTQPNQWDALVEWSYGTWLQTDRHPVMGASYYEAEAFCNWAGGHLPTEAQWEKAARWNGSEPYVYPWGNLWDEHRCNTLFDSAHAIYRPVAVGSYNSGASPCGCQDMTGNLMEWCSDRFQLDYYQSTPSGGWIDPQGPEVGDVRVLRGGAWSTTGSDQTRCAWRRGFAPNFGAIDVGFRLAR